MSDGGAARSRDPPADTDQVEAAELYERITAGDPVRILDVRDRDAVEAWRIDGPNVTHTQLATSRVLQAEVTGAVPELESEIEGDGPIIVVCAEGEASDYVAGVLADAGFEASNLAEGMEGWAKVYRVNVIKTNPTVLQCHRPSSGCLSYMIVSDEEAAVIDPLRAFTDRYVTEARDRHADIVAVFDSHLHADHISGLRELAAAVEAPALLPTESVERGLEYAVTGIEDGDEFEIGSANLQAIALPGHTTGMTGFTVGDMLFTADSLFLDGVARPDLQVAGTDEREGLASELYATLTDRLSRFTDETLIAPGHASEEVAAEGGDLTAPLGTLRKQLAAFDLDRQAFVERVLADLPPPPANAERIVAINRGTETADAATAFELELGPNNCAAGTWN
ncbi:MAG: MBL fold metallo-hydrolase [Salinirussus sp.]